MTGINPISAFSSPGEDLYLQAQGLEKKADYFPAQQLYQNAKIQLVKEGKSGLADQCRYALTRIEKIKITYPHSQETVRKMIKEKYPGTTDARIDQVLKDGRLPQLAIGGQLYYFEDFLNTLYHIYPDFRTREEAGALGQITKLFDIMSPYIYGPDPTGPGQVLVNPLAYSAEGELAIPRDKLPARGLLKVWLPLPLVSAAQPKVEIISVYPEKYVKYPLKQDGDIALVYMEIPLEEIKGELKIGAKFKFSHYEERFKVEPEQVGQYDKASALYKRYTASDRNIAVTPTIRAAAQKLAGTETNPYRLAKKFYDHIVYDLDYSFTPHAALDALELPESVYVHEHGYGDCGAQSMYFAALCRAVGIPARAAGGMQLFPGSKTGCGGHFWAQFYLPNYGWIPVDTSVGQLGKYMPNLTEKQKRDFIEYFFARMDPFRYLIQVDVDIPLVPRPEEPPVFGMVLQNPALLCREMDRHPGILFMDSWKINVKQMAIAY